MLPYLLVPLASDISALNVFRYITFRAGGAMITALLIGVALVSNIMAVVLQSLCARLAVATRRDPSPACRDAHPPHMAWALWLLAGPATDPLAEGKTRQGTADPC